MGLCVCVGNHNGSLVFVPQRGSKRKFALRPLGKAYGILARIKKSLVILCHYEIYIYMQGQYRLQLIHIVSMK